MTEGHVAGHVTPDEARSSTADEPVVEAVAPTSPGSPPSPEEESSREEASSETAELTASGDGDEAAGVDALISRVVSDPTVEPAPERRADSPADDSRVQESAVIPVPGTLRQERRPSFWKRIGLRASGGRDTDAERLLARFDVIESRLQATDLSLGNRIQQLDERFTEVWEVEEQLSQLSDLRATVDEIAARQLRLGEQLGAISGRLTLVSVLAVAATGAGLAAIFLR